MKIYLLSIEELNRECNEAHEKTHVKAHEGISTNAGHAGHSLREQCLGKLDSHRYAKVQKLKTGLIQNQAIGAGLLLQLAYEELQTLEGKAEEDVFMSLPEAIPVEALSVSRILSKLRGEQFPREISYRHLANGKPDFAESGKHFNLSHSGEYVACAIGSRPIGLDIQQERHLTDFRIAERYFSQNEKEALRQCESVSEKENLFFEIWVKKEAYAKLTGEGIAKDIVVDTLGETRGIVWQSIGRIGMTEEPSPVTLPAGYHMAICLVENGG